MDNATLDEGAALLAAVMSQESTKQQEAALRFWLRTYASHLIATARQAQDNAKDARDLLHAKLREHAITGLSKGEIGSGITHHYCEECRKSWPADAPEQHLSFCLVAPDAFQTFAERAAITAATPGKD